MKKIIKGNPNLPSKVIINEHGDSASKEKALEDHDTHVNIIFFRGDGWSLGAPSKYEEIAYKLWENNWVRFARSPDFVPKDMSDYE